MLIYQSYHKALLLSFAPLSPLHRLSICRRFSIKKGKDSSWSTPPFLADRRGAKLAILPLWLQARQKRSVEHVPSSKLCLPKLVEMSIFTSSVSVSLGFRSFIAGGVGNGNKVKAVNQLLACIHMATAAEALAFSVKKGMDLDAVMSVILSGAAYSYVAKDRKSFLVDRAYE